jgi:hypothetical protein
MAKGASRDVYDLGSHFVLKRMYHYRREFRMAEECSDYFPKAFMAKDELLIAGRVGFIC